MYFALTSQDSAVRGNTMGVEMTKERDFDLLYRAHYTLVLRFIERRIDENVAADLCAQCFEIAWRKFDPECPFGLPWFYQTARNLLGNAYRRRDRQRRLIERIAVESRVRASNEGVEVEVHAVLASMHALDREAIQLTYWEGLSAAEVGEVLSCSEQAVWKRISRAKKKLREQLAPYRFGKEDAHDG